MRIPVATYRLQLTEDFTLQHARAIVPYLARLGISDLYLSPVFEARPGSTHGYDVTDPTRIRASIGGETALRELADAAAAHDMGILLDIVPNHMAASVHNPWWRDVLAKGRRSRYAHFFDIDWQADASQRLRLPILGDTLDSVIARGELDVDPDTGEAVYFETRLPLAAGTISDRAALTGPDRGAAIREVLDRQNYELAFWRTASERMNYRRFFDITDLAGVRVEQEDVFDATHSLIRSLAAEGVITGLRIDHIDGLRDPAGYLRTLRSKVRGPGGEPVYTVVEKILEHDERLPTGWACEGTTGYEFLSLATGLLVESAGHRSLADFYVRLTGDQRPFGELVREKKLLVMERLFGSEVNALGRALAELTGLNVEDARLAVIEVTASMEVYRTYTCSRSVRAEDRARIDTAVEDARRRNPDHSRPLDALRRTALLEAAPVTDRTLDWVMRWQQLTGPVMAKGFEDTALYCHNALLAANDVGSDPVRPHLATAELHALLAERRSRSPHSLNATATHDTKRGEDTRARIAVLSELPDEWRRLLRRWSRRGDEWKAEIADEFEDDVATPDADVDSLLYQTLVGAWPVGADDTQHGADADFTTRIKDYMAKAVREAKEQTSWRRPDEEYEQGLATFVDRIMEEFGREGLSAEVADFAHRIAPHGALNSLAQALLRITSPGVPDTYQGTELWSFTLVDPDNRAPVDYDQRGQRLDEMQNLLESPEPGAVRTLLEQWHDGRIKLLVTALALRCRGRRPDIFDHGDVVAVSAHGERSENVFAYARSLDGDACIVILPRWTTRLAGAGALPDGAAWAGTHLELPGALADGVWRNALTGERMTAEGGTLRLDAVLATLPCALLESTDR
jgi:(1->4)-alpha-D-glucan 1-alpha-D-glucosylmutase